MGNSKLITILTKIDEGHKTPFKAYNEILVLFGVSNNEERVVSCSSCKWMKTKFEYKCDGCIRFSNWEQDTDC